MNFLATPAELIGQLAQNALGRAVCFLIACSVGRGFGCVLAHGWNVLIGMRKLFVASFFAELGGAMLIVPMQMIPQTWELCAYALCVPLIFSFMRFELALRWLLVPFFIMGTACFASHFLTP